MDKKLFKHELFDAWENLISSITVVDSDKDNIIINDDKYTIEYKDIEKIKELINNKDLYQDREILHAPVMDGTIHKIKLLDKVIKCNNLWYWTYEESYDDLREDIKEEDIKYTIEVVSLINNIQEVLNKNKIEFYIIDYEKE